jgi:hypothetical protein
MSPPLAQRELARCSEMSGVEGGAEVTDLRSKRRD